MHFPFGQDGILCIKGRVRPAADTAVGFLGEAIFLHLAGDAAALKIGDTMKRSFGFFVIAGILAAQMVDAEEPPEVPAKDWTEAAKFSLATVHYSPGTILVVDQTIPEAAVKALRGSWSVISSEELPEKDEYVIPPGPYMLIRKFDVQDGFFVFRETMGQIKKSTMGHCGQTLTIVTRRNSAGEWELSRPMESMVC